MNIENQLIQQAMTKETAGYASKLRQRYNFDEIDARIASSRFRPLRIEMTNPFVDDKNFSSQASSGKVSSVRTTKGIANEQFPRRRDEIAKPQLTWKKIWIVYKGYINRRNSIIS